MDIYEKKCLVLETTKRKEGFYINENGLAKKQTKQQQKKTNKKHQKQTP
jgi:hypothetical protein